MFGSQEQTAKSLHSDPEQIHRLITRQVRVILLPTKGTTQKGEHRTSFFTCLRDGIDEELKDSKEVQGEAPKFI